MASGLISIVLPASADIYPSEPEVQPFQTGQMSSLLHGGAKSFCMVCQHRNHGDSLVQVI